MAHAGSYPWEPGLVHLEDGIGTRLSSRQRGGQAGREVGPEEVRHDWALASGTNRAGQQFGRGRLAVRLRDKHYLPARTTAPPWLVLERARGCLPR
jgi:hypothetical protein